MRYFKCDILQPRLTNASELPYETGRWKLHFWATVCKTVRPMLSDRRCPVLSVCDVGVLWLNGWMDQDATWYSGKPRPRPRCVRWGPSSPKGAQHPNFWSMSVGANSETDLQISTGFASWQCYCTAFQYWASAKLRRWTKGATYIRQGGLHVGHWPTFLVSSSSFFA